MITLGIETSCDETALSIIETRDIDGHFECRVISSLVHSQAELHSAYGGVFPTLAKREHSKNLFPLLQKLMVKSGPALESVARSDLATSKKSEPVTDDRQGKIKEIDSFINELQSKNSDLIESFNHFRNTDLFNKIPPIDRIAVTEGPGLEPTLWVGIIFARILGMVWGIPIVPVNHMEGHIVGSLLESDTPMGSWQRLKPMKSPAIALLISGGHTELVKIDAIGKYEIIGQTKDDAVGEAFDKSARLLGLPYPGGPHVSMLAYQARQENIKSEIKLPRPMLKSGNLDFSFSGLKTAVLYAVRANTQTDGTLTDTFKKGLAREFEDAVTETLDAKLCSAIEATGAQTIIVGGGVSANRNLREHLIKTAKEYDLPLYLPSQHVSGDNALMIALAGALDSKKYSAPLKADGTKRL